MKKSMKSKLLVAVMTLAMVFTMIPMMGAPAYADDPAPPAPGIALGSDVLSVGSNTSGAATVHMAGTKWLVIGYGVSQEDGITQVASSADTMTLIAADNLKTGVQFNPDSNPVNTYKDSNLCNEVNALTDDTNGVFSKGEKEGIVARDLAKGDYTDQEPYTNGIAGDEVKGALLWPLSTQEAFYMDSELRRASFYWWLRSPGNYVYEVANVSNDGFVDYLGINVHYDYGVRPAFNFNLKSVLFTSAAEGGKSSGDVGAGSLKSVEPNSNNEWKLTLESGHDNFKVENVSTCDGKTVNIKYSGAVAKKGEYISAIITDEKDAVKYYGNLIEFADGDSASGTASVTIDGKMESTDKLYVINEQLNGDKKTDYSSALSEITIPSPTGHSYTEPTYSWEKDGNDWKCTATRVCGKDTSHKETETVTATSAIKTPATCEGVGTTTYTATFTNTAFAANNKDADDIPKTDHKYGTWTNYDADQHQRVCERDATHVEKENHSWDGGTVTTPPTTEKDGVRTLTCTVCGAEKTESIDKLPAYEAKDSTGNAIQTLSWQKGSGKSLDLTIECDIDDSQTYGKFTGLEIDGEPVADSDYTAAAGSLKLSIKPSYLETLSVGDHSMKAKFSDGSTELTLRVLAAAEKKDDKGKPGKVSPKTGDDSNPLLWYTLLFSSLMVLLGSVVIQRRYARSRRG